jgi:anti-anti-sigma factor
MTTTTFELTSADTAGRNNSIPGTVVVRGEVDISNVEDFRDAIAALMDRGPVVLDMSDVTYFDSAGFAALAYLLEHGRLAIVVAPSSQVRRATTIMNVPVHDDAGAAHQAIAVQGS